MSLEIKTATGKSKKDDKPDRLTIDSPIIKTAAEGKKKPVDAKLVDVMIDLSHKIENLEGEMQVYRKDLLEHTTAKRDASLKAKVFVKTVDVNGTHAKIQVQFQDRYTPLAPEMEVPLKEIFDDKFETMFAVNESQSLKWNKIEELKEILGDRFDAFFDTTKTLTPVKEFQAHYFTMTKMLNAEQKETIQKILDACQSSPAVKFPK